jgi:hypothetical protein
MKQTPTSSQMSPAVHVVPGFLRKNQVLFFFLGLFAAAMIFVFLPVMSAWTVIASPDDVPFYQQNHLVTSLETLLAGGGAFTPFILLNFLPQIGFHEMRYIVSMLLFGLSAAFYLRTRKLDRLPAYGAGVLLSFSGYIFTLFCAGHMGFFLLMALFFWCFGLWNKALETGKWRYFLLFPACAMWAQAGQPDVWVLFAAIFGVYALRGLWQVRARFFKLLPKLLLSVVVAGLIGGSSIAIVITQRLSDRDKQIADSSRASVAGEETPEAKRQKEEDRWIFATNWSLPLADTMELLIPGFLGDNAMTPPYPYWGALGRPYRFEPGKMMPNYRQHTTYLGLISVLLALIGVCAWGAKRKTEGQKDGRTEEAIPVETTAVYRDVPFWVGVWVICLILALGRYTPFYSLFYAIPYMDYLRAPVKFLHFTELATGLLAGFGMQALLTQRFSEKGLKRLLVAGGGVLLLFVVIGLGVSMSGAAIEQHIAEIGFGQYAATLRGYTSYNCLRAIGLMVLVLILFYVGWLKAGASKASTIILAVLVGIGVFDLAAVARRYVMPISVQAHHQENAIVKEMKRATQGRPASVANYVTRNIFAQDWLTTSLTVNGFPNILPDENDPNAKVRPLAIALQKEPLRCWELTGPRFVLLSRQQATQVMQMQLAKPLAEFELGQGSVRRSSAPSERSILLMERTRQPIYPCVFFNWTGGVKPDDQIQQLIKLNTTTGMITPGPIALLVSDAPAPTAPAQQPPQPVTFSQMRGEKNVFVTRATVQMSQPGLLVWNERYSADLKATLDNKEVPLYQANGQWCAIQVPAGKHTLTCQIRVKGFFNLLSMAASILVVFVSIIAAIGVMKP